MFPSGWYAILHSQEVKNKPISIKRFGIDLVVWLNPDNQVIVMDDKCPHRSAKLSLGRICDGNITCPFHGFQFNSSGECILAPELGKPILKLRANTYQTKIIADMIWINIGGNNDDDLSPLLEIHEKFKGIYSLAKKNWQSNITRCIENQLDYTHLPVVHKRTIGKNFKMPIKPKFIRNFNNILSFHRENSINPSSIYVYPNSWILNISDNIKIVVYFVPMSAEETRFYLLTYRSFLNNFLLRKIVNVIFNYFNLKILKEDQSVVVSQGAGFSTDATNELLIKHDGAIKLFRQIWKSNI